MDSSVKNSSSKDGDKSDKDFASMPRDQQFLELVKRKLRKANKKMTRITSLETSMVGKKINLNEEQKKLLASKEVTSTLVTEFTDLQTQMQKLLEERKETSTTPVSVSVSAEKKERQPRKERKRKEGAPATSTDNSSSTSTSAPSQVDTTTQNDKTAPAASSPAPQVKQSTTQGSTSESNTSQGQVQGQPQELSNQGAQRDARPPKPKKQWEFQKDIYLAQFKHTFAEDQNGKYVAVSEGKLLGPYETSEELLQATGADKNSYFAVVGGDESKNPIKRPNNGRRGGDRDRERGPRTGSNGTPRGDRERGPRREGQQRDSNARGGFNARRGESGTGTGSGSGNQSSPSQARQQS